MVNLAQRKEGMKPLSLRIPSVRLEREGSLPRIELGSVTPTTPVRSLQYGPSFGIPKYNKGSIEGYIPPNTKKLRMRSFLWVKPALESPASALFSQLVPVLLVNIAALSSGLALGFSAILLPQIRPDSERLVDLSHHIYNFTTQHRPFTASLEQGSWIASIFGIGAVFGGLSSAVLGNKYGRRASLLVYCLVDLLGWCLVAGSQDLGMMLVGRFLAGFAAAGYSPCVQIYVAEITQVKKDKIRFA
ncbi:solute carrier family 2, facilitated glucose transporter member 6 [Eurytemora carolleeae]|uniref:solute carrier family 2, facilitated glucose transporter member 6 n=1 Tax=Eurytemora carolleeae TaxID=1294199 RepID=UPI000C758282|nr:solute carrier family 2, facilitated glucose transporter member 6 [Eurytemora carolleeae]|eukprot:XP_023343142.1 solute carrier family 2, facilitated glucose transporter member 6-like [Eurytemora affinis]